MTPSAIRSSTALEVWYAKVRDKSLGLLVHKTLAQAIDDSLFKSRVSALRDPTERRWRRFHIQLHTYERAVVPQAGSASRRVFGSTNVLQLLEDGNVDKIAAFGRGDLDDGVPSH